MSTMPSTQEPTDERDLLTEFESKNIPEEYKEYYKIKRNNFFATIQKFPGLWQYYISLDRIWLRECETMNLPRDTERMFPLLLYFNAHAKIRVSVELALSGCMAEARSIMRDAIEFVAHAHAMAGDVTLQKTWLCKDDDRQALEAFRDAFERNKKQGIFKGLDELGRLWGQLSESGSHATISAICERFATVKTDAHVTFRINYCGLDERNWALSLFGLLLTCATMEQVFYADYESRFKFDETLVRMRADAEVMKEKLREFLKKYYKVEPPNGIFIPKPVIFRP